MVRVLAMAGAVFAVLVLGYLAMGRSGEKKGIIPERAAEVSEIVESGAEKAVDALGPAVEEVLKGVEVPRGSGEPLEEPLADAGGPVEVPVEDQEAHGVFDRQWGVLEETQGLLAETGEILK